MSKLRIVSLGEFYVYTLVIAVFFFFRMITDVHLAIMSNALGVVLFLLVVLYHYINANYSKWIATFFESLHYVVLFFFVSYINVCKIK